MRVSNVKTISFEYVDGAIQTFSSNTPLIASIRAFERASAEEKITKNNITYIVQEYPPLEDFKQKESLRLMYVVHESHPFFNIHMVLNMFNSNILYNTIEAFKKCVIQDTDFYENISKL